MWTPVDVIIFCLGMLLIGGTLVVLATWLNNQRKAAECKTEKEKAEAIAKAAETAKEQATHRNVLAKQAIEGDRPLTIIGDYMEIGKRDGFKKDELDATIEVAKLCKGGRMALPGCASFRWNDGPDIELAKQGLSKAPLYGNLKNEDFHILVHEQPQTPPVSPQPSQIIVAGNTISGIGGDSDDQMWMTKVLEALRKHGAYQPQTQQPSTPQAPVAPTTPATPPTCVECGIRPQEPKPGGGFHARCAQCHQAQPHRNQQPQAGGGIVDRRGNPLPLPNQPAQPQQAPVPGWART